MEATSRAEAVFAEHLSRMPFHDLFLHGSRVLFKGVPFLTYAARVALAEACLHAFWTALEAHRLLQSNFSLRAAAGAAS